jgi:hypothetical protein
MRDVTAALTALEAFQHSSEPYIAGGRRMERPTIKLLACAPQCSLLEASGVPDFLHRSIHAK